MTSGVQQSRVPRMVPLCQVFSKRREPSLRNIAQLRSGEFCYCLLKGLLNRLKPEIVLKLKRSLDIFPRFGDCWSPRVTVRSWFPLTWRPLLCGFWILAQTCACPRESKNGSQVSSKHKQSFTRPSLSPRTRQASLCPRPQIAVVRCSRIERIHGPC